MDGAGRGTHSKERTECRSPIDAEKRNALHQLGWLQMASAMVFLITAAGFFLAKCLFSPGISFIVQNPNTPWIMYPAPVTPMGTITKLSNVPIAHFFKQFWLQRVPQSAEVLVQSMREFELYLNDRFVHTNRSSGHTWKTPVRVDITSYLKTGENKLTVAVRNLSGPPLLKLTTTGLPDPITADETWQVQQGNSAPRYTIVANDMKTIDESSKMSSPLESFLRVKAFLALVFLLVTAVFLSVRFLVAKRSLAILPWIVLVVLAVLWLGPIAVRAKQLPVDAGFDAGGHLNYVSFILYRGALPLATDGWSMYHPPLFYLLAAGLLKVCGQGLYSEQTFGLARFIPLIFGIAHIGVASLMARKIFQGEPGRIALTTLMAGIIPMNIYISTYISNESPLAFFAGCTILGTVWILLESETKAWVTLATGAFMGLAMLTKFTGILLVPVVCFFVGAKVLLIERNGLAKALGMVLLLLVGTLTLSGWYYARNILEFGRPLVSNWDLPGEIILQWPGFHTPAYFLSFGEAVRQPYFAAFHSFWDGIYSTFWGDGEIAGRNVLQGPLPMWNYDFMWSTYLLALPASAVGCIGALRAVAMALKDANPHLRITLSFLLAITSVIVSAMLSYALKVPIYSTVKAFFGLMLVGPIAVFFALGFESIERRLLSRRLLIVRAAAYGWLGTLVVAVYLSYIG